jgi:hypothetical protein
MSHVAPRRTGTGSSAAEDRRARASVTAQLDRIPVWRTPGSRWSRSWRALVPTFASGWRILFLIGALGGVTILIMRRSVTILIMRRGVTILIMRRGLPPSNTSATMAG